MAWNSPRTWTVGEKVTAALMNTHLRDQLLYLKSVVDGTNTDKVPNAALLTGIDGNKISAGTINNYQLAAGIDGAKITDSTIVEAKLVGLISGTRLSLGSVGAAQLGEPYDAARIRAYQASFNQALTNNIGTNVGFNTTQFSKNISWDNPNVRFSFAESGYYLVGCTVKWAGNATGTRVLEMYRNGSTKIMGVEEAPGNATPFSLYIPPTLVQLSSGDVLHINGLQTSGGALSILATGGDLNSSTLFTAVRVA